MKPPFDSNDPRVRAFQNAAFHTSLIMDTPCPCDEYGQAYDAHFGVGILDNHYKVRIRPTGNSMGKVWDTVYITTPDGKEHDCGNRCGGREFLAGCYALEYIAMMTGEGKPYQASNAALDILA